MLLDVCKSNSLGELAVLMLTCPVLVPRAPGDFLLLWTTNKKKASHATHAVFVLTVPCMIFMYAYGNNSDPSLLSLNLQPQESKYSLQNHQTEEQYAIK